MATEAERLAAALDGLAHYGRCLASVDYAISNKREGRYPRPSEEECRLAQSDEPLDGDNALNGAWPMILRGTAATLKGWAAAWQSAKSALDVLPGEAADILSTAFSRPHWSITLAKLLNDLAGHVPDSASYWSSVTGRLPSDWIERIEGLEAYTDEVRAIPSQVATINAAQPPAASDPPAVGKAGDDPHTNDEAAGDVLGALPDEAMMNHIDLAKSLGLESEPLRKRLDRWRNRNLDGWKETENRQSRDPKYIYSVGAIRGVLREALASA